MTTNTPAFRVLLVDDNTPLRGLVAEAIEADSRFEVVGAAGDGRAGVDAARALQPDVVLLDLAMPEMDGIEALPLLGEVAPRARVVVFSGFSRAPFAPTLLRGGALGYIEKGASPRDLRNSLLSVLGALDAIEPVLESHTSSLPDDGPTARHARRFVAGLADGWAAPRVVDDLSLLVSELVTNAVIHARSTPQVVVQVRSSILRVEVHDDSPVLPAIRLPDEDRPGGRGLRIVDQVALEWGIERRPGGKAVWFHYPLVVDRTDA